MRVLREWIEYLGDEEWGNEIMERTARERFAADLTISMVTVIEHAGWWLSWNRDMICVGTANDTARMSDRAMEWRRGFDRHVIVGRNRHGDGNGDRKTNEYYPCIMAEVA